MRLPLIYTVALTVSAAVSLAVVPVVLRAALRRELVDRPGGIKAHTTAVPRLGGVGILAGLLAGLLAASLAARGVEVVFWDPILAALLGGALLMFAVGLSDDLLPRSEPDADGGRRRDGLSAKTKLLLQFVAAAIPIYAGLRIHGFQIPGDGYQHFSPFVSVMVSAIWIVGITNALNFIDGLDGLAGGASLIMAATIALTAIYSPGGADDTAIVALALLGGIVGFLRLNFPPASIFMGDGGSHLLGYLLATLAINGVMKGATVITVVAPLVILALPIGNLAGVVLVRVLRGDSPLAGDRSHLHHRLQDAGWSDLAALLFVYAICGLCGSAALALIGLAQPSAALAGGVAALLVAAAAHKARPNHDDQPSE